MIVNDESIGIAHPGFAAAHILHEVAESQDVMINAVLYACPSIAVFAQSTHSPHDLLVVFLCMGLHLSDRASANSCSDAAPWTVRIALDRKQEPVVLVYGPDAVLHDFFYWMSVLQWFTVVGGQMECTGVAKLQLLLRLCGLHGRLWNDR